MDYVVFIICILGVFCVLPCLTGFILVYCDTTRCAFDNRIYLIKDIKYRKQLLENMLKSDFFTQTYYFFNVYDRHERRYVYCFTKENTARNTKVYTLIDNKIAISHFIISISDEPMKESILESILEEKGITNAVCMISDKIANTYNKITDDHKIDIIEQDIRLVDTNNHIVIKLLDQEIKTNENFLSEQIYSHTKLDPKELNYLILSYIV